MATNTATQCEYQILYNEPGAEWKDVEPEQMQERLSGYYKDIDAVLEYMADGSEVQTPFAWYRIKPS